MEDGIFVDLVGGKPTVLPTHFNFWRRQMKTVEEIYEKISVLKEKALMLHRERYKTSGNYDKTKCQYLVDDIQSMAKLIGGTQVNLEANFADLSDKIPSATGK